MTQTNKGRKIKHASIAILVLAYALITAAQPVAATEASIRMSGSGGCSASTLTCWSQHDQAIEVVYCNPLLHIWNHQPDEWGDCV